MTLFLSTKMRVINESEYSQVYSPVPEKYKRKNAFGMALRSQISLKKNQLLGAMKVSNLYLPLKSLQEKQLHHVHETATKKVCFLISIIYEALCVLC